MEYRTGTEQKEAVPADLPEVDSVPRSPCFKEG